MCLSEGVLLEVAAGGGKHEVPYDSASSRYSLISQYNKLYYQLFFYQVILKIITVMMFNGDLKNGYAYLRVPRCWGWAESMMHRKTTLAA